MDDRNHRIAEDFIRIGKNHRSLLEHCLNKNGLFRGQHQVLMCVWKNPGASQKELAGFHNVSTATIAVTLKKLEKGGYVRRIMDQEDNRSNKIGLTEKGTREVETSLKFFQTVEKDMLEGFSDSEKEDLYEYLERILSNLEHMQEKAELWKTETLRRTEKEGGNNEAL